MAFRWTDEMMMKFANLYKHHECLWQTYNARYKNKEARNASIQNIVDEMNIPDFGISDCKNKIKNLRSHYCQELKKIQESKNTGATGVNIYQPTLPWFGTVDGFLRRFVQQSNYIPRVCERKQNLVRFARIFLAKMREM